MNCESLVLDFSRVVMVIAAIIPCMLQVDGSDVQAASVHHLYQRVCGTHDW